MLIKRWKYFACSFQRVRTKTMAGINLVVQKSPADPFCPTEFKEGVSFVLNPLLNLFALIFGFICYHI